MPQVPAEGVLDLIALVLPQQPVIHENAGQPVAYGTVHQCRGHRGVHAAREAADHPALGPDLLPDAATSLSMKWPGVQSGAQPQTSKRKLLRISPPAACGPPRDGTARRRAAAWCARTPPWERSRSTRSPRSRGAARPRGRRGSSTPAFPPRFQNPRTTVPPSTRTSGAAVLPAAGPGDLAAGEVGQQLHAITDAEYRDAQLEQLGIGGRDVLAVHRIGPAGEDDPLRLPLPDPVDGAVGRVDLAVARAPRAPGGR